MTKRTGYGDIRDRKQEHRGATVLCGTGNSMSFCYRLTCKLQTAVSDICHVGHSHVVLHTICSEVSGSL